ncbi:ABC transporter permease [Paenibacillus urinalis]|uniref:FtsX-like permease family protein n=1 Tax=Paenibacillus urinalis TaxID=521520 RepID=A0AAX3N098_9BACL|nr:FtsX-like permease family protein [Paenibacillus urinalis]WDH83253.1 FtsX-like permease family protein [Paenibacillus urinalis]
MYSRIIRNDISRSKAITITTTLFVAAAAALVSLAAILIVHLSGSLGTLMSQAETPHFMQMHSGDLDMKRLTAFAEQDEHVDEFQVIEFVNMDGAQIQLGDESLANSVQDNGFSPQSEGFDYLLDLKGDIITVTDGQLYVPISYMRDSGATVGDQAVISGKELTIAGFLRDSQMNSSLSGSKRFLVSDHDFAEIKKQGSTEYLIEFRLKELSMLSSFEAAYTAAGLEANGPTVTYSLFQMMNALSDGMMIAVILLVSILVVAIAWMCIRFTLLAKIEDDYREIGVMKAIGMRISDIKRIYLAKYTLIAAAGSLLGFVLSLLLKGMLLENIRLYMGESENSAYAFLLGIIGILLVFLAIVTYVSIVLNRFRRISAAEAVRFGISQDTKTGAKRFTLNRSRLWNTNLFLGIKDVLARKKLYITMLAVLVISSFILLVPQNLYNTISADSFTRYMGIGKYDMRIDIQQADNISDVSAQIANTMHSDNTISKYTVLTTKIFQSRTNEGTEENIKVELGDHSIFPVAYTEGSAPVAEDEIALSTLNAEAMGKKIGDQLTLVMSGKETALTVTGIYSDITNGGKTAKAVFTDSSVPIMWSIICAEFLDQTVTDHKVSEYAAKFKQVKVTDIDEYVTQTFGSTISSVEKASYAAGFAALIVIVLITLIFMKLLVAKDRYSIAVMKALGYTNADIKAQYVARSAFVLIVGLILGTLLANTLGELLAGAAISSFGASTFQFTVDPISAYLLSPLMMVCAVLVATIIGTSSANRIKIFENIKG